MPIDRIISPRILRQEDGAVAVIVALLLTVLLGFVALGVDVASLYRDRAQLQADADLAAMSSVAAPENSQPRAVQTLERNRRGADSLSDLQTGRFLRNPEIPAAERFVPLANGSAGINAVALTLQDAAPLHFARIFSDSDHVTLTRRALAIRTGAASFSLGSHLARLDPANLNALLSNSFGASVTLGAGDYALLAQSSVNLGDLIATLDSQSGANRRNPAAILDTRTTGARIAAALASLLDGRAATILGDLERITTSLDLSVAAIVGGIDTDLGLTATEFLAHTRISALDAIRAVAQVNNLDQSLTLDTAATLPSILSAQTRLAVGEPPARSGWIAIGEEGVQLHRAATRLRTDIELAPDLLGVLGLGVSATGLRLPLYVELAGATATLEEITCGAAPQDTAARFSTSATPLHPQNGTALATIYLGSLPAQVFASGPVNPAALDFADILDLSLRIELPLLPAIQIGGITLQARARATLGSSQTRMISFTGEDISAGRTTRYFGSGDLLTSGIADLLSPDRIELRVKPGQEGLVSGAANTLVQSVLTLLPARIVSGLTAPIDTALDDILNQTGLRLGEGELTLTGHHCERVQLVR
ncbi:MAG: pilus assembly protein TadG-related protein [Paracoccaceae bacterium]